MKTSIVFHPESTSAAEIAEHWAKLEPDDSVVLSNGDARKLAIAYLQAHKEAWNAAISACRGLCMEVNEDAHEAAKAKDATDYVAGYQDAAIDCDEEMRALKV